MNEDEVLMNKDEVLMNKDEVLMNKDEAISNKISGPGQPDEGHRRTEEQPDEYAPAADGADQKNLHPRRWNGGYKCK